MYDSRGSGGSGDELGLAGPRGKSDGNRGRGEVGKPGSSSSRLRLYSFERSRSPRSRRARILSRREAVGEGFND